MVEEIRKIANQSAETVLEELCLVAFLIYCFVVVHRPYGLLDVFVREEVAGERRGSNMNFGLVKNVIEIGGVGKHGSRVKVGWERRASREDCTLEMLGGMGKES